MWIFLFTEMLLFGALFIVYTVYRFRNPVAFHLGAQNLNVVFGTANTVILLTSSAAIAMSITAVQRNNRKLALAFIATTLFLGLLFLLNKYFEWSEHIRDHIYPGSSVLGLRGQGDVLFFGLYFFMTGLHALHVIVGLTLITIVITKVAIKRINSGHYVLLENSALYWHLVDIVWIFLYPMLYLIT